MLREVSNEKTKKEKKNEKISGEKGVAVFADHGITCRGQFVARVGDSVEGDEEHSCRLVVR